MKIEEINALARDENDNKLRKPINAINLTDEVLKTQEQILLSIRWFLKEEKDNGFVGCLFRRLFMKRQKGVNSFKGIGTRKHPYKIETDFGGGTFYDARNGFNKKQYPKWIEQNFCYSNCLQFILLTNKDCQLLSGICYMEKPFLHSVILINDKIIDFNYHVVMDKGLYFALTKFECLAELDSNHVRETTNFVLSKKDVLSSSNLTSLTINFAYDDVLEYLSNEQRQLDEPDIGI